MALACISSSGKEDECSITTTIQASTQPLKPFKSVEVKTFEDFQKERRIMNGQKQRDKRRNKRWKLGKQKTEDRKESKEFENRGEQAVVEYRDSRARELYYGRLGKIIGEVITEWMEKGALLRGFEDDHYRRQATSRIVRRMVNESELPEGFIRGKVKNWLDKLGYFSSN
ncbi:hypothetical protein HDU93_008100 [Gonapodya sp. JEL0774]|nr:hypothetical protein HDU93_008100 [Gonapodya sp. JEL0774]